MVVEVRNPREEADMANKAAVEPFPPVLLALSKVRSTASKPGRAKILTVGRINHDSVEIVINAG